MNRNEREAFERLSERYSDGRVPWDEPLPPPEVISYLPRLTPGRALDLGCGFGRASIFLAKLGWEVDAVDFVPQALAIARERASADGLEIRFHLAQITELDFLEGPYQFALDVGCCHSLNESNLKIYHDHLARLLASGGVFMLFARIRGDGDSLPESGPAGLVKNQLLALFADSFDLEWMSLGDTEVEDQPSWPSGWFRWIKK